MAHKDLAAMDGLRCAVSGRIAIAEREGFVLLRSAMHSSSHESRPIYLTWSPCSRAAFQWVPTLRQPVAGRTVENPGDDLFAGRHSGVSPPRGAAQQVSTSVLSSSRGT
jgi:hypothetical protein